MTTLMDLDGGVSPFPAEEVNAVVQRSRAGEYHVHIEDLNGGVTIPLWCLDLIYAYAKDAIAKDESSPKPYVDPSAS